MNEKWTNLSIGNTVMLRSGSQPMTVYNIREDYVIDVVWMVGGYTQRDSFHFLELVKLTVEEITL